MTTSEDIGYTESPVNGTGIKRSRTTKLIRAWQFERSSATLKALDDELGNTDYPGLYLLFEGDKKVYIGEAKSIYKRLDTHNKSPEDKIKDWDTVLCFRSSGYAVGL